MQNHEMSTIGSLRSKWSQSSSRIVLENANYKLNQCRFDLKSVSTESRMEFQSQTRIITSIHGEIQRKMIEMNQENTPCDGMDIFKKREIEWENEVKQVVSEQFRFDSIQKELRQKRKECELKKNETLQLNQQEIGELDRINRILDIKMQELKGLKVERDRLKGEQDAMIEMKHEMLSVLVPIKWHKMRECPLRNE